MSEDNFSVRETLLSWLNQFSVKFDEAVPFSNSRVKLDFLLPELSLGIMIPNWRRPISVSVLHKAVHALHNLNLSKVIVVCNAISYHAEETLEKMNYPIEVIDEYGLSEIFALLWNPPNQATA